MSVGVSAVGVCGAVGTARSSMPAGATATASTTSSWVARSFRVGITVSVQHAGISGEVNTHAGKATNRTRVSHPAPYANRNGP